MVIFGLIGVDRVVWAKEEGFGTTCGHSEPLVGADVVPWLAFPSPTMVTRVGTDPQPEQKLARLVRVWQLKEINGPDPDTHEVPMHSFACFFSVALSSTGCGIKSGFIQKYNAPVNFAPKGSACIKSQIMIVNL